MNKQSKLVIILCMVLCFSAVFSGCNEKVTTIKSQSNEDTLTIATQQELTVLSPLYMGSYNLPVSKLVYEGLVKYVDGEVKPCLAESWNFNEQGTKLTFKLREGVQFHDGEPFNAEAVKANIEFWRSNPSYAALKAVTDIKDVNVIDEQTIEINYSHPYFAYMTDFCWPDVMVLVSPNIINPGDFQTVSGVVGTGPYKYDEIVKGQYTKFTKNQDYWGETPLYNQVIAKYIPDSASRLKALKTGEIDLIFGAGMISYEDYNQAINTNGIKGKISKIDSRARNITLNLTSDNLSNIKVRKAIAYAIDKKAISEGLTYGYEPIANSFLVEGSLYEDLKLNTEYSKDLKKANTLLDEQGWIKNSKGIREKDGKTLSLVFTYNQGDTAISKSIAMLIKSQLAEIGIEVKVKGQEQMEWFMGYMEGNFDMTLYYGYYDYAMPNCFFTPMITMTPQTISLNSLEESKKFIDAINEFGQIDNDDRVKEIFNYLVNYDLDNVLDIPLTFEKDLILFNSSKIKDYDFIADPAFFDIAQIKSNK